MRVWKIIGWAIYAAFVTLMVLIIAYGMWAVVVKAVTDNG